MTARADRSRAAASDDLLVGPIRGDLLGADHLASRARTIARGQRVDGAARALRPARLLARLTETRAILRDAQTRLLAAGSAGVDSGPSAEWLLDNYHVVQEQLQEVRSSLPSGYYRELPELAQGPLTGYPRVYEIAISLISHTEARVDLENVDLFVEAFQSVTPLSIGELWAMPAMLRLGLIESVRRMTLRTVERLTEREHAELWAERILAASAVGSADWRVVLREFADAAIVLSPHFVARLLQVLRHADGASPPLRWLEHFMQEAGVSPEVAVAASTQRLALTQIMMANSITSLRNIGRRDWRLFVEHQSAMEAILRTEPSLFYPQMTFPTRDSYRHVVERIARQSGHRETSVAQWAVDLARQHVVAGGGRIDTPEAHVGFHLVDDGLPALERLAGYVPTTTERLLRLTQAHPDATFVGGLSITMVAAVATVMLLSDARSAGSLFLLLLFALLPALDVAVSAFNQLVMAWLPPRLLARLDLHANGVPAVYRTVVVIPTLFGTLEDVREALENLEVQFLANREAHLVFAVLSDFTDAPAETTPDDDAIVAAAVTAVQQLNERYADGGVPPFHLLHRPRRWNPSQGVWMGWERKRGKLAEFNRLLRGEQTDAFSTVTSGAASLRDVKYVITLDADTVLPPDAAPALVGALAHPLNRAVFDEAAQRMVRGYGILQPQVGVSLPSAHRSRFAAIASGHPGVDPYTVAASDVYQDLYGEGSFTGKGIYDVDAFQSATRGRFPENVLLSHDLLEGNYARAGLATDVIVYDDYPSTYDGFSRRKHRWIRGDWQLMPWLQRTVPGPDGPERNRLSLVSRWKILDNLRRSSVELTQLVLLVAGWTVLPGSTLRWTLIGLGAVIAPWASALLRAMAQPPFDKSWRAYYGAVGRDTLVSAKQAFLAIAFLPHQAASSADAIVRTLYRVFVSHRTLLEWQTAMAVERRDGTMASVGVISIRRTAILVGVMALAVSAFTVRRQLASGAPLESLVPGALAMWTLVAVWLYAPRLASNLSRATAPDRPRLSAADRDVAQRYARAHWQYFDRYVTAETHWLAPDNVQTDPDVVVAMRTSPTNIGLQLLATVSAFDLGWLTAAQLAEHLERTMRTLTGLRQFRGHFFNWYALDDLRVLDPPYISTVDSGNIAGHLIALRQACLEIALAHPDLRARFEHLAEQSYALVSDMDFRFLYASTRLLFTIGYHPDSNTPDDSFYDLLASEARLASFMAIAKNDVPVEHWFRLSRALNRTGGEVALVSWTGSMFEYLMPVLVMRSLPQTLLAQSYHAVLARHRSYARKRRVPYGISESAYNVRDRHATYQYRAFGIADLALRRGLGKDLVIAPYATALSAMIDPPRAMANLRTLESMGVLTDVGFSDALDYTRPDSGHRFAVVHTCMAHHVGMSLVALTNVLLADRWQQRFHADSLVKSAELLLHERVPRRLVLQGAQRVLPEDAMPENTQTAQVTQSVDIRNVTDLHVALLGSDPYSVMLTPTGTGYSRYNGLAVTRWRADRSQETTGQFCYIKELGSGRVWSAAHQPVCAPAELNRASVGSDCMTFHRRDGDIETRTTITVVPGDAAEVRCVTITNYGRTAREFELTSYGEVVLGSADADRAHPAFANLFVETEWHEWCTAITASRRPRTPEERPLWCVHLVDAGRDRVGTVSCETDRARFVGRGRTTRAPAALEHAGPLSGTIGAVLDPIFAIRTGVRVAPGQSASVAFTTLVATSRAEAFALADRYHDSHAAQRALDVAWTSTLNEQRELGITPSDAAMFQDLAAELLGQGQALAPPLDEVLRNTGSQPRLWINGISGDLPIVLAYIEDVEGLSTLREVCMAHRYWRHRGLRVDLVVLNTHMYDYLQELRDAIADVLLSANDAAYRDQPGGVFVRRRDAFTTDDFLMLSATARLHITCDGQALERVLAGARARVADARSADARMGPIPPTVSMITPANVEPVRGRSSVAAVLRPLVAPLLPRVARTTPPRIAMTAPDGLAFANGVGGLQADDAYCMIVDDTLLPPAPWINVIANPHGGFVVSERGAGCVWAENAYFYRLTPWHNDPVSDPVGDCLYLQDTESGSLWSATPAPVRCGLSYRVVHAPGKSTFEHEHDGFRVRLELSLPTDAAVKLSMLTVQNTSDRRRRLTVTAYAEWTLGARREETARQVRTRYLRPQRAIVAQNHFDPAFSSWVSFLAASEPVTSMTASRSAFLGRSGSLAQPEALTAVRTDVAGLDGACGVGYDPCAALQMPLDLAAGETRTVSVLLGGASSEAQARELMARLLPISSTREAMDAHTASWTTRLGVINVHTPDRAFNAMLNTWLPYQTLGCRMWARTGLYQSSGAFGFRDQLQDAMALVYAEPALARAHILQAAARQFVEGDVQHWWHAHSGRGVRTRFSDDLAWLPYVVAHYIRVTGDVAVLDAYAPFLTMRELNPGEQELYDLPAVTEEHGSLYEHCCRALRRACTTGVHGLPLMGSGDWNDGMSHVGVEGRGESVWLAWFLISTAQAFAPLAESRGERDTASWLHEQAARYTGAVQVSGWDGAWYRRAYYDDGTALGSAEGDECQIDSIAQSWSVISGAGAPDRQTTAMQSLNARLVREEDQLIMLLTPPFDRGAHDPGYIKGYVPGVRENGAQYTHAALWAVQAISMHGDADRAYALFQMLNPLTHAATAESMRRYAVEPYVIAADVYTAKGLTGRGGWTWYTGSASWMYRVGLEQLLGFTKVGDTLQLLPRIPSTWPGFDLAYRHGTATYQMSVVRDADIVTGSTSVSVDGATITDGIIPLCDDGIEHTVIVRIPSVAATQ